MPGSARRRLRGKRSSTTRICGARAASVPISPARAERAQRTGTTLHLFSPRTVVPDSVMPAYPIALRRGADRPRQEARDLVAYLETLGRARELAGPEGEAHAREACNCPDDEMAQMAFSVTPVNGSPARPRPGGTYPDVAALDGSRTRPDAVCGQLRNLPRFKRQAVTARPRPHWCRDPTRPRRAPVLVRSPERGAVERKCRHRDVRLARSPRGRPGGDGGGRAGALGRAARTVCRQRRCSQSARECTKPTASSATG